MDNQIVEGPVKLLSINQSTHTKRASNEISTTLKNSISNRNDLNQTRYSRKKKITFYIPFKIEWRIIISTNFGYFNIIFILEIMWGGKKSFALVRLTNDCFVQPRIRQWRVSSFRGLFFGHFISMFGRRERKKDTRIRTVGELEWIPIPEASRLHLRSTPRQGCSMGRSLDRISGRDQLYKSSAGTIMWGI